MKSQRINNFRMGAYALLAVGLINLRYQTGSESNLSKSLVLIIPGALILALASFNAGKNWLESKNAAAIGITLGFFLLAYSFFV